MPTISGSWGFWDGMKHWNFTLYRLIGLIDFGAANFTEIIETVRRIPAGDEAAWQREWFALAERVEQFAQAAERQGNTFSARNAYFRSSNYFRMSQFFMSGDHPGKVPTLERMDRNFRLGLRWIPNVESVSIPYENTELDGYFVRAQGTNPAPVMVYINGADSLPPEVYFTAGKHMAEAGIHFLVYYAPGVGLSLYKKGLPTRSDSEAFVSPAIDWVLTQENVDPSRIILIGESFAGYLVPRAAAHESRVAAAVVWSPVYHFDAGFLYRHSGPSFQQHLLRLLGVSTYEDLVKQSYQYSLEGVAPQIRCPLFLIQGSEDFIIPSPMESAIRLYTEAGSKTKRLRVIERDEGLGGVLHCQKDNLHVAHFETLNWLYEIGLLNPSLQ